jgi:hypothetical protein
MFAGTQGLFLTMLNSIDSLECMIIQGVDVKEVNLIAYGNKVIRRVVVSVDGDVYFVCKSEEFEKAKQEGREPICVGFRREYIVQSPVTAGLE